jgi:hypothetical protein
MSVIHFYSPEKHAAGNALINWTGRPLEDLLTYAHTYQSAACRLVHAHRELQLNSLSHHVLPILFLYRHSLELYLKAIVYHAAEVSIARTEMTIALPRLWREHSLVKLHRMAIPVLHANLDSELLSSQLAKAAAAIDAFDAGSYAFRYPVTATGNSSLPTAFLVNMFFYSDEMELLLDECLPFCRGLKRDAMQSSAQMKLALHSLTDVYTA